MIIQPNQELTQAIARYQNGDMAAFDIIYYNSLPYITKCVLNVLNRTAPGASEELRQDIIQDTYMTIADKLNTLQAPRGLLPVGGADRHAPCPANLEPGSAPAGDGGLRRGPGL